MKQGFQPSGLQPSFFVHSPRYSWRNHHDHHPLLLDQPGTGIR